jgi:hypothetical protein
MKRKALPKQLERRGFDWTYPRRPPERPYKHTEWKSGGNANIQMHFAPGNAGRKYGSHNKIGHNLKVAILDAAANCEFGNGSLETFLIHCAENHTADYLKVMSKLIPYRLDVDARLRHLQTADEIRAELRARGIPVPDRLFPVPKVPELTHKPAPVKPRDEDHLQREEPEPSAPYTWSPSNTTPLRVFDFDHNKEQTDADSTDDPPAAAE